MPYTCFDVSIDNTIAHIVMNRPEKRNAMVPEFWDELPEIIADIDDHARTRVIVWAAVERCPTRSSRIVRLRRRKNAPAIASCWQQREAGDVWRGIVPRRPAGCGRRRVE
jgi:hypothetical protein